MVTLRTEDVFNELLTMDSHRHRPVAVDPSKHQREMFRVFEFSLVSKGLGGADGRIDAELPNPFDQLLTSLSIGNHVRNGDDFQLVLGGELEELRQSLDRAIVIDHLGQQAHWWTTGKHRQIDSGFSVSRTHQHSALARDQRENVARTNEVPGANVAAGERQDGISTFLC